MLRVVLGRPSGSQTAQNMVLSSGLRARANEELRQALAPDAPCLRMFVAVIAERQFAQWNRQRCTLAECICMVSGECLRQQKGSAVKACAHGGIVVTRPAHHALSL